MVQPPRIYLSCNTCVLWRSTKSSFSSISIGGGGEKDRSWSLLRIARATGGERKQMWISLQTLLYSPLFLQESWKCKLTVLETQLIFQGPRFHFYARKSWIARLKQVSSMIWTVEVFEFSNRCKFCKIRARKGLKSLPKKVACCDCCHATPPKELSRLNRSTIFAGEHGWRCPPYWDGHPIGY